MEKEDYLLMHSIENIYWYWLGKKDLINKIINKFVKKENKSLKILDVGCGTGSILKSLKSKGELYGIDISDFAIKMCSSMGNFKLKRMDAENLKFPKETFDLIILLDILEHVKNDKKVIDRCYGVLKKNGVVIITVPAHNYLWNFDDTRLTHQRRYSKKMLIKVAGKLKVKKISYIHFFVYPLVLFARVLEKFKNKKNGTMELKVKERLQKGNVFNLLLNQILLSINKMENSLITCFNMPNGVGLIMVLEKKGEK